MVINQSIACLSYVYGDIAFNRWDIATKVYEVVYYFQMLVI